MEHTSDNDTENPLRRVPARARPCRTRLPIGVRGYPIPAGSIFMDIGEWTVCIYVDRRRYPGGPITHMVRRPLALKSCLGRRKFMGESGLSSNGGTNIMRMRAAVDTYRDRKPTRAKRCWR